MQINNHFEAKKTLPKGKNNNNNNKTQKQSKKNPCSRLEVRDFSGWGTASPRTGHLRVQGLYPPSQWGPFTSGSRRPPGRHRGCGLGTTLPARSPFGPLSDPRRAQPPARSPRVRETSPPLFPCHSLTGERGENRPSPPLTPHGPGPVPGPGRRRLAGPPQVQPCPAGPRRGPCCPPSTGGGGQSPKAAAPHQVPESPPVPQRLNDPRRHRPPAPSLERRSGKCSSRAAAGAVR